MPIVFKVTRSTRLDEDHPTRQLSARMLPPEEHCMEYFEDKFVTAPMGYIFAFDSLLAAQAFAHHGDYSDTIWEAETTEKIQYPPAFIAYATDNSIDSFWGRFFAGQPSLSTNTPPLGTVWVKDLKLTRMIKQGHISSDFNLTRFDTHRG